MSTAIRVENLSKAYQIGEFSTGTISRDLARWWAKTRGKEDPFLKIGEENDRTRKGESDIVWSLKDLNFDIEQGDAVGIIGKNGAGKSTLLKILSRVTTPTTGSVKVKGRIASLLEVGTGFHPELTGRENIFLNGAILGMRKKEIRKRFDEIVDFAGIERYIDTPVKRYSSGMYVRLAFAVAAHLESEILIVDEVLAVGDAEFQKKCLGKMGEVSKGEGRTVLFVSHNMGSIRSLCGKSILLNNGFLSSIGDTSAIIKSYIDLNSNKTDSEYFGKNIIQEAKIKVEYGANSNFVTLSITIKLKSESKIRDLVLGVALKDCFDATIFAVNNRHYLSYTSAFKDVFEGCFEMTFTDMNILPGNYTVDLFLGDRMIDIETARNALTVKIEKRKDADFTFSTDQSINKFFIESASWKQIA